MKKPLTLLLISYAALIFIISGIVAFNMSCEKSETVIIPATEEDSALYYADIYDHLQDGSRSGDGLITVVILGTKKSGSYTNAQFQKDVDSVKAAIQSYVPFTGLPIVYHQKKINGNLGCNDNVTGSNNVETIACSDLKVNAAVMELTMSPDLIIVIAQGYGHGSFNGDRTCVIGIGSRLPVLKPDGSIKCTFEQAAYHGKLMKEIGRRMGLAQQDTVGSKMNSGTSGGCDIWRFPYTTPEQQIIIQTLSTF